MVDGMTGNVSEVTDATKAMVCSCCGVELHEDGGCQGDCYYNGWGGYPRHPIKKKGAE